MGDAETLKPLQVHSQDAEQPPTTETDVKTGTAKAALVEVGALSEVVEGEEGAGSDDLRACLFQLLQVHSFGVQWVFQNPDLHPVQCMQFESCKIFQLLP